MSYTPKLSSVATTSLVLILAACKGDEPIEDTGPVDTGTMEDLLLAPNDPAGTQLPDPADFDYYTAAQFEVDHVLGGFDGATHADDNTIVCTSGCEDNLRADGDTTLYPVDNGFGYDVLDFGEALQRPRDGVYEEGWVGTITDGSGDPMGIAVSSAETQTYKVEANKGTWCAGLDPSPVKCSTEHFVTMEHIKTCDETIPYWFSDPETGETYSEWTSCMALDTVQDIPFADLVPDENDPAAWSVGTDYGISVKDDGKPLYRFGDTVKKPTDMRMVMSLPLPTDWATGTYTVTRAELSIVHTITNNPNDQIRPEDFENEGATGRTPSYTVDTDGKWLSAVDCYEGDGTFIPAGTVLKNPEFADSTGISADLVEGYTNAWYRTLDRDPFAWDDVNDEYSPRWRLKAPKFGQDLPAIEIPTTNCAAQPLQSGEQKYGHGALTTTTINLLDFGDKVSPLATSTGWQVASDQPMATAGLSANGVTMTEDFDLSVYIKGDKRAVQLYSAHLFIDYEAVAQ